MKARSFLVGGLATLLISIACGRTERVFHDAADGNGGGAGASGVSGGQGGDDTQEGVLELVTDAVTLGFNEDTSFQLVARGGQGGHQWTIAQGSLPEGLNLEDDGTLVGRPIEVGEFVLGVRVEDESDQSVEGSITLKVERTKRWLAYIADHRVFEIDELYIYDLANPSQPARRIFEDPEAVFHCEFSPDGTKLACAAIVDAEGIRRLVVIDPETGDWTNVSADVSLHTAGRFVLRWSPDSSKILFLTQSGGPPDLYLADASLTDPAEPVLIADLSASEPVIEAIWMGEQRVLVGSDSKLYTVQIPEGAAPSTPQELLIPNTATLPSPPSFKQVSSEPNLVFFHAAHDPNTGTLYVLDARSTPETISMLTNAIARAMWDPAPNGLWFQHQRPAPGPTFATTGPTVRSITAPDDPWVQTGNGPAFWAHRENVLFWAEGGGNPKLMKTTFTEAPSTAEHPLDQELSIAAVATDDTHLLLTGASGLYLWNGVSRQALFDQVTQGHTFAPNATAYAYRDGTTLRVGRVQENAQMSNWAASHTSDRVDQDAWSADSAVLVYRADRISRGAQLFRLEVLDGKPSGQSVHPIANCDINNDCPSVKAFALQP